MFTLAGPLRLIAFAARQHHIDRNYIANLNAKEKFTLDLALSINDFKQIDQIVQNALNSSSLFGRDQNAKFSELQTVALNFSNKINDFSNHTSPKKVNHLWMMIFGKNTLLLEKKVESGIQKIEFQNVDYADPSNPNFNFQESLKKVRQNLTYLECSPHLQNEIDLLCDIVEWIRLHLEQGKENENLQKYLMKRLHGVVGKLLQIQTEDATLVDKIVYLTNFLDWAEKARQIDLPFILLPKCGEEENLSYVENDNSFLFPLLFIDCKLVDAMISFGHKILIDVRMKYPYFKINDQKCLHVFADCFRKGFINQNPQSKRYSLGKDVIYTDQGFMTMDQEWIYLKPIRRNLPNPPNKTRVEIISSFQSITIGMGHSFLRIHTPQGELYSLGLLSNDSHGSLSSPDIFEFVKSDKKVVATYELEDECSLKLLIDKLEEKQEQFLKESKVSLSCANFVSEMRDFIVYDLGGRRVNPPCKFSINFYNRMVFRIQSFFIKKAVQMLVRLHAYKSSRLYKFIDKSLQKFEVQRVEDGNQMVFPIDIAVKNSSYTHYLWEIFSQNVQWLKPRKI